MKREFTFIATCFLTLEHKEGDNKSTHKSTSILVEVPPPLDQRVYLTPEGFPTKEGAKIMSETFIAGLVANIHNCHQRGYRDSAEHLRHIIKELERGFVSVAQVGEGVIKEGKPS